MINDEVVAHFAAYITGHPDTPPDAQHRAATRAVLEGLDREGRLLPSAARMTTFRPGTTDRPTTATIHLDGPHSIFRFMVNLLNCQLDIGGAAAAVLVDLRDHMGADRFDPMARSLLGDDRYAKLHTRFERDFSCDGCQKDIQVGHRYVPTADAGAVCAACCKGLPDYDARLVKRVRVDPPPPVTETGTAADDGPAPGDDVHPDQSALPVPSC